MGYSIILGVAAIWDRRKGLDDFIKLSSKLNDDQKIVLVGLNKNQMEVLPDSIVRIGQTNSVTELAELYSIADVFLNLTYEDNYPTTNLEAISCGTPVVTYNTGGSPESAEMYGETVEKGNIEFVSILSCNNSFVPQSNYICKIDRDITTESYMDIYKLI